MQDDNFARVKSNKWASDDDAADLLSGILNETEDEALAEQERIEAELRAKEEAEKQAKESEAARRRQEAEEKLSAELDRLQQVEERRTQKIEALKIEELKERGEWVDPEEERRKVEALRQQEAEAAARKAAAEAKVAQEMLAPAQVVAPPQKKSPVMMIALTLVVLVALGGAGVAFAVLSGYKVDETQYSKAIFTPMENQVAMVEKGFTPMPKAEKAAPIEEIAKKSTSSRSKRKARTKKPKTKPKSKRKISTKPKQNKANKVANELEDMLSKDVFGE